MTHAPIRMALVEDSAGNLGGIVGDVGGLFACPWPAASFCNGLAGKVSSNGAVLLDFSTLSGGGVFRLRGAISGTTPCLTGGTGSVISGNVQIAEGSFNTFSINNCPIP